MQTEIKRNIKPSLQLPGKGGVYRRYFKRQMDFILSLIAIIVLSPILLVIGVLVKTKLGSPVIFKQKRPGLNEKIFTLYKFRTMTDERDKFGELLPDGVRLTKFGRFLRETSLDELPELWNIFLGDMSIIGPRPQLVRDMVFMSEEQRERHNVRPGLSGLAQVRGRNGISWDKKLSTDLEYIRKVTFLDDVKIVVETVLKVFKREGITGEGMATAADFGDYLLETGKVSQKEYDEKQAEAMRILNGQTKGTVEV
jgi:undecaprenyl phosphate N,N'-diacetylbacillosamine 1-phosphate transferase